MTTKFYRSHVAYALGILSHPLPFSAISADASRVAIVYFALVSLDVCGFSDALTVGRRETLVSWLYSCFARGDGGGGFCGGPVTSGTGASRAWSVPMTYAAIASLIMLGDDCSRIDRTALTSALSSLQQPDGSIDSSPLARGDGDVRFIYAAAATVTLLDLPLRGLDACGALRFIRACQSYEGGFALQPGGEAHGGATYCAIAARRLLSDWFLSKSVGRSEEEDTRDVHATMRWLVRRQDTVSGGFTGRAGKEADSCYSFWIGGASAILLLDLLLVLPEISETSASAQDLPFFNACALRSWVATCTGAGCGVGFAREPEEDSDPFHTAYALAGLALAREPTLRAVDAVLGLTVETSRLWAEKKNFASM